MELPAPASGNGDGLTMRRINKIGIVFFFLSAAAICFAETHTSMWQVTKSEHFVVYYEDAPAGFIDGIISVAEKNYFSILDKLGFTRFDRFWTWENRCKVYIYSKKEDYSKKSGQPEWSEASVNVKQRVISTFLGQENFKDTLMPHEMGHLIFREYIGFKAQLPLWLDEGVACLQESSSHRRVESLKKIAGGDSFITIENLSRMNIQDIKNPAIFYAEATACVDFLLERYGKEKFVDFCRQIRDNTYWFDALKKVYDFKDLTEMNAKLVEWLTG